MTRILPLTIGTREMRFLAERDDTTALFTRPKMQLNRRLQHYAARIMCAALDAEDYEVVTIVEYALYGKPTSSLTMAELADRFIRIEKEAHRRRDKKMQIVLKAAAVNAAG